MTNDSVLDELEDVLEAERQALLTGDIETIRRLAERKEAQVAQLSGSSGVDQDTLLILQDKLKRNQELLDHALSGIRSVAQRLQAMRRVRQSLDTYTAKGTKQTVDLTKSPTLEKRA